MSTKGQRSFSVTRVGLLSSVIIILLAFAVRLHNLGGDSYWVDEIESILSIRKGWDAFQGDRVHPGLYYLITAGASAVYGQDEFGLRLTALFAGTLAVPLLILAGKMLGRSSIGLWAALLLALSPFHLRYSQEVRMYAQLMTLTLLSFIFLYMALRQPKWSIWAAYVGVTALNLYTHYGSLIVLASQSALIAVWAIVSFFKGDGKNVRYPIASALVIVLLYLPWIPRLLETLQYNVGATTVTDTGTRQSLTSWASAAYFDFGMYDDRLAAVLLGLCALGLIIWIIEKRWRELGWLLSGLLLPLLFIFIFQVARGALSRYLIYMLPFYLLAIAIVFDRFLTLVNRRLNRTLYTLSIIGIVLVILLVGIPKVQAEHRRVYEDWKGIVGYLDQFADDGDILLAMSMNFATGFNNVSHVMPTYLERSDHAYHMLVGNRLTLEDAAALKDNKNNVWAVVNSWTRRVRFDDPSMHVADFQSHYYVINEVNSSRNALESAINLYEQILPFAFEPMPRCLLMQDLSVLYVAAQAYWDARQLLDEATEACPFIDDGTGQRMVLEEQIVLGVESQDWSQLMHELDMEAADGDVLVGMTLERGDNRVTGTLPFYIEDSKVAYQYLSNKGLEEDILRAFAKQENNLWIVVTIPGEVDFLSGRSGSTLEMVDLNNGVYLLHDPDRSGTVLEQLIDAYAVWLLPQITEHYASCEFMGDLALMYEIVGDDVNRAPLIFRLEARCDHLLLNYDELHKEIHLSLRDDFENAVQVGDLSRASEIAPVLIRYDHKNKEALELATVENLWERFRNDQATIAQNGAVEPVTSKRFTMPHNGDWGDVIFTHPPASVTFDLELPDEPVFLRTRVALDPQSWTWGGDGVTFVVTVQEGVAPADEVYRSHVPNDETGHDWQDVLLSLKDYAGKEIRLTLGAEPGPAGDSTGDWAGWEAPRLIWSHERNAD